MRTLGTLRFVLLAAALVALPLPSAHACSICEECRESRRGTGGFFCWGSAEGAEFCADDVWGNCWVSGRFCGCIVVY